MEDNKEKNDSIIAKVSGWIREHQLEKIKQSDYDRLLNLRMPNVYEKGQKFLLWLNSKTKYPGSYIPIKFGSTDDVLMELVSICWAYNEKEVRYLMDYLARKEFITNNNQNNVDFQLMITPEGFSYIENLSKNVNSNLGFCAMWFDDSLNSAWQNAIEPAIKQAGFEPIRIDKHPHNGVVVDEIIALIRRSKFVIADLTGNRGGVYFEAGFAKGFGLEVIFTCKKDWLDNLYF
ncbi:MAG: hypothetical protein EPO11_07605 [Gammaproteobacteria bacterium]|nr:MAG: hypothetical protein EPO11_07605 [Gammaproteobacteria bacterium]